MALIYSKCVYYYYYSCFQNLCLGAFFFFPGQWLFGCQGRWLLPVLDILHVTAAPNFVFKNPIHSLPQFWLTCCFVFEIMFPRIPQGPPPPLYEAPPSYEELLGPDNPSSPLSSEMDIGTIRESCHYFYTLNTNNIYEVTPRLLYRTVCPHHVSPNRLSNQGLKS